MLFPKKLLVRWARASRFLISKHMFQDHLLMLHERAKYTWRCPGRRLRKKRSQRWMSLTLLRSKVTTLRRLKKTSKKLLLQPKHHNPNLLQERALFLPLSEFGFHLPIFPSETLPSLLLAVLTHFGGQESTSSFEDNFIRKKLQWFNLIRLHSNQLNSCCSTIIWLDIWTVCGRINPAKTLLRSAEKSSWTWTIKTLLILNPLPTVPSQKLQPKSWLTGETDHWSTAT